MKKQVNPGPFKGITSEMHKDVEHSEFYKNNCRETLSTNYKTIQFQNLPDTIEEDQYTQEYLKCNQIDETMRLQAINHVQKLEQMVGKLKEELKQEVKREMILRGEISDIDQQHNKSTKNFSYQLLDQMIQVSRSMISENEEIQNHQQNIQEEIKEFSTVIGAYQSHTLVIENQINKNEKGIGFNDFYRQAFKQSQN